LLFNGTPSTTVLQTRDSFAAFKPQPTAAPTTEPTAIPTGLTDAIEFIAPETAPGIAPFAHATAISHFGSLLLLLKFTPAVCRHPPIGFLPRTVDFKAPTPQSFA